MLSCATFNSYLRVAFDFYVSARCLVLCLMFTIDLIHKWRPIYYSFIFMLISLPSLLSMWKIQRNVCSKMSVGRLISMNIIE